MNVFRRFGIGWVALLLITMTGAVRAATITVDTNSDGGNEPNHCSLRDAIFATINRAPRNGCTAGDGNDTIQFAIIGGIVLGEALPDVPSGNRLTITGPSDNIEIDAGAKARVINVDPGAELNLKHLGIAHATFTAIFNNAGLLTASLSLAVCLLLFTGAASAGGCANCCKAPTPARGPVRPSVVTSVTGRVLEIGRVMITARRISLVTPAGIQACFKASSLPTSPPTSLM